MSIERLLQEGSIQAFQSTDAEIDKAMEISRRDLNTALEIRLNSPDWAFNIAYNAVLQACKAYMYTKGYRPASSESHKHTFEFMLITTTEPWLTMIEYFDRVRKKRHRVVYDEIGLVSEKELAALLDQAGEFIGYIENTIRK